MRLNFEQKLLFSVHHVIIFKDCSFAEFSIGVVPVRLDKVVGVKVFNVRRGQNVVVTGIATAQNVVERRSLLAGIFGLASRRSEKLFGLFFPLLLLLF